MLTETIAHFKHLLPSRKKKFFLINMVLISVRWSSKTPLTNAMEANNAKSQ